MTLVFFRMLGLGAGSREGKLCGLLGFLWQFH